MSHHDPFPLHDDRGSRKAYLDDTHRLVAPERTLERVRGLMPVMGITRLAHLTGLDIVGLPVVMAVRPNARSLAVSSGKGLSLAAAQASGLMEAIELYHAEHILAPLLLASQAELRYSRRLVDVARLPPLSIGRFHEHRSILWIEGWDILQQQAAWAPFEMVHCNFTLPLPSGSGCFPMSSNGLASGNHVLEAISHGICEVVERDALSLWHATPSTKQKRRRVALDSIDDAGCSMAVDAIRGAGLEVGLWDITTDVSIPTFECLLVDREQTALQRGYATSGAGCHPAREVAALRAITEAVQGRMIYVAGSRDDRDRAAYDAASDPGLTRSVRARIADGPDADDTAGLDFDALPTVQHPSFAADVRWQLEQLAAVGIEQVIVVDLQRAEFDVPVVRVIVPGLEGVDGAAGYVPGPRAIAARQAS